MAGNFLTRRFKYCNFHAFFYLILANIIVFALTSFHRNFLYYIGFCPSLFLSYHMFWQPFTYMFVHGSIWHLLGNMAGLFFFGMSVEKALGSKEFLLLYFLTGILSGLCSFAFYIFTGNPNAVLIGASGALFGILFAFAVIFPKARIFIYGIIPVPSPLLVILYTGIELFSQFTGFRSNVAHFTHLFGFLASFLYFLLRFRINPFKIWKDTYRR